MDTEPTRKKGDGNTGRNHLKQQSSVPGKGGLTRVAAAFINTLQGLREGMSTEAAIKQEAAIVAVALPLSVFIAESFWVWVGLIASLLFVLSIEFLNTSIERLCDHVQPDRHEAIRVTKDLASAGVFFALLLAALVWGAAALQTFGFV